MLHPFRLFYITLAASFFLVACDSGTNESSSGQLDVISVSEPKESTTETEIVSTVEPSSSEEAMSDLAESLESESAEVEVIEEELAEELDEVQEVALDPVIQMAIEEIVKQTQLDPAAHTFMTTQSEDYIEVEVRERKAADSSPMVGRYRYLLEDKNILTMDYLTGEYVLFETAE